MPVTGYTVTVLKSETIDLNISIDQAFQFIVSCGVVIPPQQLQDALAEKGDALEQRLLEGSPGADATDQTGESEAEPAPNEGDGQDTDGESGAREGSKAAKSEK